MTIRIEPIAEQHVVGFHAVLDLVARQRKYLAIVEAPPLAETREFVHGNIARGVPQFVALDGETVVGWCDILPETRESCSHCGRLAMGVHPDYRSQGIGRRLLRATLEAARKAGLERVELHVVESNEIAIALYKLFGFEQDGYLRNARKLDGKYESKLTMSLFLPDQKDAGHSAQAGSTKKRGKPRATEGGDGRETGVRVVNVQRAQQGSARSS